MSLIIALFVFALLPRVAAAQRPEPLPIDSALRMGFPELVSVSVSPDRTYVAYTVRDGKRARAVDDEPWRRTGIRDIHTGTDIWISNLNTGEAKTITGGQFDNFMPVWSPDGRHLAFISDRDGRGVAELWVWDAGSDVVRRLSEQVLNTSQIEWSADGSKIFATSPPTAWLQAHEPKALSDINNAQASPQIAVFRAGKRNTDVGIENHERDAWDLDWALRSLSAFDVASGTVNTLIADERIVHFGISPDGSQIAYTSPTRFEEAGSQQLLYDLRLLHLSSDTKTTLAADIKLGFNGLFSWAPDGRRLTYRTYGVAEKAFDCYIVDVDGSVPRNISNLPAGASPAGAVSEDCLWDTNQRFVYFISGGALWRASVQQGTAVELARIPGRQIKRLIPDAKHYLWTPGGGSSTVVLTHDDSGKQDGFYQIELKPGRVKKLVESGQCYSCVNAQSRFVVSGDSEKLFYFAEDATHSPNLWMSSPEFANPARITNLNSGMDNYRMGSARLIDWLSDDGEQLRGVLLLPSNYHEGKRYPLVVWVYGGVRLSDNMDRFGVAGPGPLNLQLFATRGYAVFVPDCPQHLGSPMLDLVKTVLPGISKLVETGIADPDRLGIMGHSNGGYSVLALLAQTNRFKAAVEIAGMADLLAGYGEMDESGAAFGASHMEQGLGAMGATPWQVPNRYIENSPIYHLDRVSTPLLLLHGSLDRSVKPFLGDEVFVGMRRLGKEAEYVKYEIEPHSPLSWTFRSQQDLCRRVLGWFDEHLNRKSQ